MNSEKFTHRERTITNKLEEAIEKLEFVNLLQQSGYAFAEELPDSIVDRAHEIALLESIDTIDEVKEFTLIEFIIQKLIQSGASQTEIVTEVEDALLEVTKLLLTETNHVATDEEASMVLRGALEISQDGTHFTNHLLDTVAARKIVRSQM